MPKRKQILILRQATLSKRVLMIETAYIVSQHTDRPRMKARIHQIREEAAKLRRA
jgi:hypothetical protein